MRKDFVTKTIRKNRKDEEIAERLHRFNVGQNTFRLVVVCIAAYFAIAKVCDSTVAIATAGKGFWELFFAWLPSFGVLCMLGLQYRRKFAKLVLKMKPRIEEQKVQDPNRQSSNLLTDGTHPHD